MTRRNLFFALLLVLLLAGIAVFQFSLPIRFHGSVIEPPKQMPEFTLQAVRGPVSLSDLRGKIIALYFGYTACPDVCPTTLADLRQALSDLGSEADQVQVVMVSVDWKRDTPESLASYLSAFHPDFLGLIGSQAQIDQVTKEYGIFYKLNEPDAKGYYSVDHTATVQVLDREGRLVLTWPYGQTPADLREDLKALIRK